MKLSGQQSLKIMPGVAAVSGDAWGTAVQILFRTMSDVATYVRQKEWRGARLQRCPLHPDGGCSFRRHGAYERTSPQGIRVARWYCPEGRRTFSLLPDFLCVRLPGLLSSIETAVCAATACGSIEAAADALRQDDVSLPSAIRWLRRRMRALAILRRISSDMGRARAPRARFAAPVGWRQIEDVAGLWRVGHTLENCVASFRAGGEGYVEQLVSGDAVYLAHDDEPAMLACIRNVGPNLWTLGETTISRRGSDIMKTREALRAGLTIAIAGTGGTLLDHSPITAMQSIAWRTEGGVIEDLEDDLDDAA
jgi:hypothetical protein